MLQENQQPSHSTFTPPAGGSTSEPLKETAKRLRVAMRNAHVGKTIVAVEVAKLADHWDAKYKAQAGGMELGPWLIQEVDPTTKLASYLELAAAAARARTCANRVESSALRWLHRQVPDAPTFRAAIGDVGKAYREQDDRPLTLPQVKRVCAAYVVSTAAKEGLRDKVQALTGRIERLEAQVRALGEEPVA